MNPRDIELLKEKKLAADEHKALVMHIKAALTTKSGIVLLNWLKDNCFMNGPMEFKAIESPAFNQRVNARRDLFITLNNLLQEGINYVSDSDE